MSRKNDGINETILGWFKRVHPEELWAIKEMPLTVTFKDMEKSMAAGQGMVLSSVRVGRLPPFEDYCCRGHEALLVGTPGGVGTLRQFR